MIKAVLFDFDGVLTTDATGSQSICRYIAAQTGIDYRRVAGAYRSYNEDLLCGRLSHSDIWNDFCRKLNSEISIDVLYSSFLNTPIDENMVSLAKSLKENGYNIGMITDNKADRMESIIAHYNWDALFDVVCVSALTGSGKNSREIFLEALRGLDLAAGECVFIDNNRDNLAIPCEMGFRIIFFNDTSRDMQKLTTTLIGMGITA